MKSARMPAALLMLAVFATGCQHKTTVIVPPQAQTPPLPSKPVQQIASLPPVPQPETPKVGPPGSDQPPPAPPPPPKHTARHRAKPTPAPTTPASTDQNVQAKEAPKDTTASPATPTQQAAAGEAPAMSPIGQLSTAGDSTGTPSKHDIEETIETTEKGLSDIKRTLTPAEQETATQIRTFLTKARQALGQDDLDGAHTLSTKAKVLLTELVKD